MWQQSDRPWPLGRFCGADSPVRGERMGAACLKAWRSSASCRLRSSRSARGDKAPQSRRGAPWRSARRGPKQDRGAVRTFRPSEMQAPRRSLRRMPPGGRDGRQRRAARRGAPRETCVTLRLHTPPSERRDAWAAASAGSIEGGLHGRPCAVIFWPISAPLTATIAHPVGSYPDERRGRWVFQPREGGCRTPEGGTVISHLGAGLPCLRPSHAPEDFLRHRFPPTNAETVSSPAPSREGMG
jgi:hypothetical protein